MLKWRVLSFFLKSGWFMKLFCVLDLSNGCVFYVCGFVRLISVGLVRLIGVIVGWLENIILEDVIF